jgi:glyoxylase-like metal-dependent hydrolase (beta-lactamase superfamily II)
VKLYSFKCGGDYADRALQDPLDADVGTKLYEPWTAYVVDHPQGPVLFDTGIPPEILTDPMGVLGPWGDMFDLQMDENDTIAALLTTIGLEPAAIPTVVMSHLHHDHAAALPLFRHAEIYVQERELAFARNPPVYQANAYMPDQFEGDYRWQLLSGEHDLFGDGRIVLFPTPGHTAGHQSVRVTLDRDTVIVMFDATYSIDKMRERLLPGILWSPDDLVASWEKIEALEREHSAVLLATHDPNVERVRWAPSEWYE